MKKKILSILLAVVMLLGIMPVSALALEPFTFTVEGLKVPTVGEKASAWFDANIENVTINGGAYDDYFIVGDVFEGEVTSLAETEDAVSIDYEEGVLLQASLP